MSCGAKKAASALGVCHHFPTGPAAGCVTGFDAVAFVEAKGAVEAVGDEGLVDGGPAVGGVLDPAMPQGHPQSTQVSGYWLLFSGHRTHHGSTSCI